MKGSGGVEFRDPAFMANREAPIHRWVPWIAGFSKQFIEDALGSYTNGHREVILDPFAGVGTTLVESDLAGHESIGFEINPYAAFAAQVKLSAHRIPPETIHSMIADMYVHEVKAEQGGRQPISEAPAGFRTRHPFYSPEVERKVLLMLDFIKAQSDQRSVDLLRLAFASTMVEYSNYSYEPSLGRRAAVGRPDIKDYRVAARVGGKLSQMAEDAIWYRNHRERSDRKDSQVRLKSFFDGYSEIKQSSVDLIVTSPPYANNYHYNRNTRPHLYWLGFCEAPEELRELEEQNFGTYWQRARERESVDLDPCIDDREIVDTLDAIRCQNTEKGVYGGGGWANYVTTYLNDCVRFIAGVKWCLRPGATALVVIGEQHRAGRSGADRSIPCQNRGDPRVDECRHTHAARYPCGQ